MYQRSSFHGYPIVTAPVIGAPIAAAAPGPFRATSSAVNFGGSLKRSGTATSEIGMMPGPMSQYGAAAVPAPQFQGTCNKKGSKALPEPNGWDTVVRGARGDGPIPSGFGNRWIVVGVLGRGVFGDIYHVVDQFTGQAAAVKVEPHKCPRKLLRIEAEMMERLCPAYSVPRVLEKGNTGYYEWVAMELVGASLAELRSAQCGAFSPSTAMKIGFKTLNCLEELHCLRVVHGDVKPGNFAMGVGDDVGKVFILDFGLSREFPSHEHKANFRGTVRYASLHAHERRNVTARDDLWSWFYMLVESIKGSLPWGHLCEHANDMRRNEVYYSKKEWDHEDFVHGLPCEFNTIRLYLQTLVFNEVPDYDYLYSLLTAAHASMGCDWNAPYDWETPEGEARVLALKQQFGVHPFVPTGGIGRTEILGGSDYEY